MICQSKHFDSWVRNVRDWFYFFYKIPKLARPYDELHAQQDCKLCTPWQSTENTPWRSLLSKFQTFLQYMYKYNLITPTRKVQLSLHPSSQNTQFLNSIICISHNKFQPTWIICGKYRQIFIYASQWSTAFSAPIFIKLTITQQILWKTPVPNVTQIWWKIWKNSHNATWHLKYHVNQKVHNSQKGLGVWHHVPDMTLNLTGAMTLLMCPQNSIYYTV